MSSSSGTEFFRVSEGIKGNGHGLLTIRVDRFLCYHGLPLGRQRPGNIGYGQEGFLPLVEMTREEFERIIPGR